MGERGPIEPCADDWLAWTELAHADRLVPLLARAVLEAPADSTTIDDRQREAALSMQLDVMSTIVRFEHDLLEVGSVLRPLDCRFAVLKGVATAHLDYEDPALRQFADVDLLVSPDDLRRVCEALAAVGWTQAYSLPRHHERFTHAITLRNGRRVELDLHQHIAHRAIGYVVETDELLSRTEEFVVAGQRFPALSAPDRLLHAAVHALTSRPPYRHQSATADVLVLARKVAPREVLQRAESFGVRSLVARSILEAHRAARLPLPGPWPEALSHRSRSDGWLLDRTYRADRRRPLLEELAYLKVLPSWADRMKYVSGYFRTDRDYAQQHDRSGLIAQMRYLASRARSGSGSGPGE